MIITEDFILLNLPKTASTFARQMIKKAYGEFNLGIKDRFLFQFGLKEKRTEELLLPNIKVDYSEVKDQHGIYEQIPDKYLNQKRKIISIIRNPFTAYVSRYTFEAWKRNIPIDGRSIKNIFPNYPNLSFSEFIEFVNKIDLPHRLQGISLKEGVELGTLSVQFIQMFCSNYPQVLSTIDRSFKKKSLYKKHFPEIIFLHTENINNELFEFLCNQGFDKKNVQFIKDAPKVNVSNSKPYERYLNEDTVDRILDIEWFLFDLFPEYKPENTDLF